MFLPNNIRGIYDVIRQSLVLSKKNEDMMPILLGLSKSVLDISFYLPDDIYLLNIPEKILLGETFYINLSFVLYS